MYRFRSQRLSRLGKYSLVYCRLQVKFASDEVGIEKGKVDHFTEGGRREASIICWRRLDKVNGERDEKRAI
jgi:hypothetical protein